MTSDDRDGASIGRAAGSLLGDVLLVLAGGGRIDTPLGVSRVGRAHAKVSFATHAEAGTWLQTPGLVEGVLVDVREDEVRVLVPARVTGAPDHHHDRERAPGGAPSSSSFDIVWTIRFVVDEQGIATSEPAFSCNDGLDDLLDDFNDGIAAGLEMHPRTAELRDGFGALGPFDELDAS